MKRSLLLSLFALIFSTGFISYQAAAIDIQVVETQAGVFDFSTTFNGGPDAVYVWSFGDGNQGSGNPVTHAYSFAGTYQVYLEVYDTVAMTNLGSGDTLLYVSSVTCDITPLFSWSNGSNGFVQFIDASTSNSGTITNWHWDFGDGETADDVIIPQHQYASNGDYTVCLTIYDDFGCTDTICNTITITNAVGCTSDFAEVEATVYGVNVLFVMYTPGSTASPFIVYADYGDGVLDTFDFTSAPYTFLHEYPYPNTTYEPCFVVTDGNGCVDSFCTEIITVDCNLSPAFTYTVGANGLVEFVGTNSGGTAPYTYYWDFGDGAQTSGTYVDHIYAASGNYTVCMTVLDANGCSTMTCDTINVNTAGCPVDFTNLIYNIGTNGFVVFSLTPNAGTMPYQVDVDYGDGNTETGLVMTTALSVSHTYASGIYTACFFITDDVGCIDTICAEINPNCPSFIVEYSIQNQANGLVELSSIVLNGTAPYTYEWSPSASLDCSTCATVIANPTITTNYCVTVTDANGCSDDYCNDVQPNCNLDLTFTYSLNGNQVAMELNNPDTALVTQYIWIVNGMTYVGTSIDFTAYALGDYVVCIQANGVCFGYDCDTINITSANADTLSGYVWDDANGNGIWDSGEDPINEALVILCDPNDTMSCQYIYTDANGFYQFIVFSGTYQISSYITWSSTYVQTFPVSPTSYLVTTTGNQNIDGFDFGFQNQGVTITGCVFYDTNNNGVQDGSEQGVAYQYVEINGWWIYTNSTGCYTITLIPGTYTVTYDLNQNPMYTLTTPASYTVDATTIGQTYSGNNFGLYIDPSAQNLYVNIAPYTTVTPGFPAWYYIYYCNYGGSEMDGSVEFTWDPNLTLDYFDPPATSISGNTATWDFTDLQPGECETIFASFDAPANLALGQLITNGAVILPIAGDDYPLNNVDTSHQEVVSSWDPNAKEVSPPGIGMSGYIDPDVVTTLSYTVHFQNTGTAPAVNVVIVDTLSTNLDWNTFKVKGASHAFVPNYDPSTGIVTFFFNNILLPDSGADYQGSMGFVEFEIDLDNNLSDGTIIPNTASIYFDFNQPVVTNTVINTIEDNLGVNDLMSKVHVLVMPNPAKDYVQFVVTGLEKSDYKVIVRNVLGQVVSELSSHGQKTVISRQNLISGVYSYEIISKSAILGTGTFVFE